MRAEEIIAEIWRQIGQIRERGGRPERVVLSPEHYALIQNYRAGLGNLENPEQDYITRHSLFNLAIYIEASAVPTVDEEPAGYAKKASIFSTRFSKREIARFIGSGTDMSTPAARRDSRGNFEPPDFRNSK